jgi:pimeloyl-ACP methyl ester carboxylesterase
MQQPRLNAVTCASPGGLHRMAYREWGDPDNPNLVLCVHGLTRTGHDFDTLAATLANDYRVVCPDVAGRGLSDRLVNPNFYQVGQYVSDMLTLLTKLAPKKLSWVGTSMGGLIGMVYLGGLASTRLWPSQRSPAQSLEPIPDPTIKISKLVLNDVGPHIEPASLARIGEYVGAAVDFDTFEQAVAYMKSVSAAFGPHTDEQWTALTRHYFVPLQDKWVKHYDLNLALPFKTMNPEAVAAGEQYLWGAYASYQEPVLIVRGAESDLLSPESLKKMLSLNPKARAVEFAGVGHAPTLMNSEQIDALKDFLNAE